MKYIKMFEDFNNEDTNELETLAKKLLVGKEIIATNSELIDTLPFRISSDVLKFKPVDCKVKVDKYGDKSLHVYVPLENIEGECTNPYKGRYSDDIGVCMVMTAWIHWHITSKNLPEHVDVMVYNNPV